MVDKSIQNNKLVVRALFCMVTAGNGCGWLRPSLAAGFLVAALTDEERQPMFKKKKTSGYGPATDKLLGYTEPSQEESVIDNERYTKAEAEFQASITPDHKAALEEIEFNEKWVRRSTYEYDIREARSRARWDLSTYFVLLVIIPLIALVIVLHNQRDERIQCGKLAPSTIKYMDGAGETLPPSCY
ncbi:MAG: hypothetical protein JNK33_01820 [Candidatus Doudnabacteria bacterium]|nr:hypothetical protein [Candidatus Doudnabacteria bacterium]